MQARKTLTLSESKALILDLCKQIRLALLRYDNKMPAKQSVEVRRATAMVRMELVKFADSIDTLKKESCYLRYLEVCGLLVTLYQNVADEDQALEPLLAQLLQRFQIEGTGSKAAYLDMRARHEGCAEPDITLTFHRLQYFETTAYQLALQKFQIAAMHYAHSSHALNRAVRTRADQMITLIRQEEQKCLETFNGVFDYHYYAVLLQRATAILKEQQSDSLFKLFCHVARFCEAGQAAPQKQIAGLAIFAFFLTVAVASFSLWSVLPRVAAGVGIPSAFISLYGLGLFYDGREKGLASALLKFESSLQQTNHEPLETDALIVRNI